jgi:fucose permease
MTVLALIGLIAQALGAWALVLMYGWLLSAIVASYLSDRKGYGEKLGLAFGMLLSVVGALIWVFWPAKPDSKWKRLGAIGRGKSDREAVTGD